MRISPITTTIGKISNSKNTKQTDSLQQPTSSNTVQFKAEVPYYAKKYSDIYWNKINNIKFNISRDHAEANKNYKFVTNLYKSLADAVKTLPSRYITKEFHYIYNNYISKGRIADLYKLKDELNMKEKDHKFLVGSWDEPFLFLCNLGAYEDFFGGKKHDQIVLEFSSGIKNSKYSDSYIYFSTDSEKDVAMGINNPLGLLGRYQFYDKSYAGKYPFKSLSRDGFFPISFVEYYNSDGKSNFWKTLF